MTIGMLLIGIFLPSLVFSFQIKWNGTDNKVCGILSIGELSVKVTPDAVPNNSTVKPLAYSIAMKPDDLKVLPDSSCFSDTNGATLKVQSGGNRYDFIFENGIKNGTEQPFRMNLTSYVISIQHTDTPSSNSTLKPSLPPSDIKFLVNDIGLPENYTAYTCKQKFFYVNKDEKWNDGNFTNLPHTVKLTVNDIHFQVISLDKPDATLFNCEHQDNDKRSMAIPIAVGASLAALIVIILVVYVVLRNRSRRSEYDPLVGNSQ